MFDNAGITFLAHSHATILHWINILLRHYAAMLNQHLCAPCKTASSSGASFFAWQRQARSEWLVMNRKGLWKGYRRQAKRRLARCLLPAFLCAHVLKRDAWVRSRCNNVGPMLAEHDATILRWTNMLVQHYATMSDTLGQHGGSVILRIFFRNFSNDQHNNWTYILLFIALVVSNLNLTWVHVFDLSFALTE